MSSSSNTKGEEMKITEIICVCFMLGLLIFLGIGSYNKHRTAESTVEAHRSMVELNNAMRKEIKDKK